MNGSAACLSDGWCRQRTYRYLFSVLWAELMQWAGQSALCIYTKINTMVGYLPDFASQGHITDVHIANIILVIWRGKNINCLSIVSCYCKLLCAGAATLSTDLSWTSLTLFSCVKPDIVLFLLLGFLSRSPCHCGGSFQYHSSDLTLRTLALLLYEAWCLLHIFVHMAGNAQMSVLKCVYLHS